MDPTETRRAHEALICEANREASYVSTKYSIQVGPLFFEWDKSIPKLEKHFPDILDDILNCERFASANGEFTTSFRHSHTNIGKTQKHPALDFWNQEIEVEPNSAAAFSTAHQRYLTIIITIL